jgi:hypothetical protein
MAKCRVTTEDQHQQFWGTEFKRKHVWGYGNKKMLNATELRHSRRYQYMQRPLQAFVGNYIVSAYVNMSSGHGDPLSPANGTECNSRLRVGLYVAVAACLALGSTQPLI